MTIHEVLRKTSGKIRRASEPETVITITDGRFYQEDRVDCDPIQMTVADVEATDWEYLDTRWVGTKKVKGKK